MPIDFMISGGREQGEARNRVGPKNNMGPGNKVGSPYAFVCTSAHFYASGLHSCTTVTHPYVLICLYALPLRIRTPRRNAHFLRTYKRQKHIRIAKFDLRKSVRI